MIIKTLQIIRFLFVAFAILFFTKQKVTAGTVPDKSLDLTVQSNSICLGETVHIQLLNSESGISYQLKEGSIPLGDAKIGNGAHLSFNHTPTSVGNISYKIDATQGGTSVSLTETITVTVNSGPNLNLSIQADYNEICKGEGIIISVENSEPTYHYQLSKASSDVGVAKIGNGSKLQFQQQILNESSTFTVYVNGASCHDRIPMNQTITTDVFNNPLSDINVTTNTTSVCPGETVTFFIHDTELNTNYNIFSGASFVSPSIPGTNGTIIINATPDRSGIYQVYAKGGHCIRYTKLDKEIDITLETLPRDDLSIISDRNNICAGEPVIISVENSENGVQYQLTDGTSNLGNPVEGNGGTIALPADHPIENTTYKVAANRIECSTSVDLLASKTINVSSPPDLALDVIRSKASICVGENASISVENTETDVNYQMTDGTNPIGTAQTGNGSTLTFALTPSETKLYQIIASKNACSSSFELDQSRQITVYPLPETDLNINANPTNICTNENTIISIENSEANVSYQLYTADGNIGAAQNGNGALLNFPAHFPTVNTTYQVKAIRNSCSSEVQLSDDANVSLHTLPNTGVNYTVTPLSLCRGETMSLTIENSESGVLYEIIGTVDGHLGNKTGNGTNQTITFAPTASQDLRLQETGEYCTTSIDNDKITSIIVNLAPRTDFTVVKSTSDPICETHGDMVTISVEHATNGQTYWLKDKSDAEIDSKTGNGAKLNFIAVSPNVTTQYKIETQPAGCYTRYNLDQNVEIEVIPLPNLDIPVQISEPEVCLNEQTQISLESSQINTSYQLFEGTFKQGEPVMGTGNSISFPAFTPDRSRTYHISATHQDCGITSELNSTASVILGIPPNVNLYPDIDKDIICEGEDVHISLAQSDNTVTYQLFREDQNIGSPLQGNSSELIFPAIRPIENSIYRIEALGEHCLNTIEIPNTVDVKVHRQPEKNKDLIADQDTICSNENIILSIEKSQTEVIYQLHDGTSFIEQQIIGNGSKIDFPIQTLNADKTYTVYAHESICTDPVPMNSSKKITVLNFDPLPIEILATPDEICKGESLDFEIPNTINGVEYVLTDLDTEIDRIVSNGNTVIFEDLTPDENSSYKVSIDNCKNDLVVTKPKYTLQSNPEIQIFTKDVLSGYDGGLSISVSGGTPPFTYIVNPIITTTKEQRVLELNNLQKGIVDVMVVDLNACKSSAEVQQVEIKTDETAQIIVNNTLTPNNDGINDEWIILHDPALGNPEVYVLNIYGQKVFHSKSYENNWKGTFNNAPLPNGAYYYIIEFDSEEIQPLKGTLSILGKY